MYNLTPKQILQRVKAEGELILILRTEDAINLRTALSQIKHQEGDKAWRLKMDLRNAPSNLSAYPNGLPTGIEPSMCSALHVQAVGGRNVEVFAILEVDDEL